MSGPPVRTSFAGQRKEVSSSVEEVRTSGNCSGPDSFSPQQNNTKVLIDNQVAIAISHNLVFHGKTKHFKIKFFFLREVQKEGEIALIYYKSENQLADIFTKPLSVKKFEALREKLGVTTPNVKRSVILAALGLQFMHVF